MFGRQREVLPLLSLIYCTVYSLVATHRKPLIKCLIFGGNVFFYIYFADEYSTYVMAMISFARHSHRSERSLKFSLAFVFITFFKINLHCHPLLPPGLSVGFLHNVFNCDSFLYFLNMQYYKKTCLIQVVLLTP